GPEPGRVSAVLPTVFPVSQWTDSSLVSLRVEDAVSGERLPAVDHTEITEIPAGETEPVVRPDGPTPGSEARAGGGGDYLSNEIAYRNTLLRDATGLDVPAGHVHTPILHLGGEDRKSTRLNSSHVKISYAVFCLKKKIITRAHI